MPEAWIGWFLGAALGVRHALEPDHLAAVSTLISEERGTRRGAMLGVFWGMGHSLSLLAVAITVGLLNWQLPPALSNAFELAVALMLIALGARAIARAHQQSSQGPQHSHPHGVHVHRHAGPANHLHISRLTFATRALAVGLLHGLAGSGALLALVAARFPTWPARLGYVAAFGVGSTMGMGLLSAIAGWPLASLSRRQPLRVVLLAASGCLCTAIGVYWAWSSAKNWLF